jgi:hypothetical protein
MMLLCVAGCAHINDPWRDSSAEIDDEMLTPNSDAYVKGAPEFASTHARTWESSSVSYHNGAVTHWPLWFEDPFEDKGNALPAPADRDAADNRFAWNGADYLHMGCGPAREFLNLVAWPASAVVTPPGTVLESDGRIDKNILGYDHDARRSDWAAREAPDVARLAPPYAHSEKSAKSETAAEADH